MGGGGGEISAVFIAAATCSWIILLELLKLEYSVRISAIFIAAATCSWIIFGQTLEGWILCKN